MLVRSGAARLLASGPRHLSPSICSLASPAGAVSARRIITTVADARAAQKKTSFRALAGFERNLATAIDNVRPGDDMPFDGLPIELAPQNQLAETDDLPLYKLRPFNVSQPLVPVQNPSARFVSGKIRMNNAGIPGDVEEMLSVFEACLHVGRLERAALVLERFHRQRKLEDDRLIVLHDRYLRARVAKLQVEPDPEEAEAIHRWFELLIYDAGLPFTPTTIACMLKATLLTAEGPVLEQRLNRYMSMMPVLDDAEAFDMGDVLTDQDLTTIAEMCPAYYVSEEPALPADAEAAAGKLAAEMADEQELAKLLTVTPEVLSTPQKGLGLKSLKQTLSLFSGLPGGLDISTLPYSQRVEVQAKLERDSVDAAIARWRDENESLSRMGLSSQLSTPSLSSKLYDWHKALEAKIVEEQKKVEKSIAAPKKSSEDLDRCLWGIHLMQSPPHRLAAVTILSAMSNLGMHGADKGVPVSHMVNSIAKIVEEDIRAQELAKNLPKSKKPRKQHTARQLLRLRHPVAKAPEGEGQSEDAAATTTGASPGNAVEAEANLGPLEARWPMTIRAKLGATLLAALMETAKIVVERENQDTGEKIKQVQPAFMHTIVYKRGKKLGAVLPNRALVDLMKREPRGETLARHLPMVSEPRPWSKFDKGGFLVTPTQLIRLKNNEQDQRLYAEAAIERGDMEQMMRALDVLGKTAWRINRPVFDVMLAAWNTGEAFANLPAMNPDLPLPPEPDSTDDPMQKRLWLQAVRAVENEKSGMHSVRCFMNFQLEIARAFRDQTFYFPHNVDFRGRAYPMPTYLNHMGADHARGLLKFAKGRPLGERGLMWLKVHLANVYGFDKASLEEREKFADDNVDNIFDSAEKPLEGRRWWLQAEDPWQCLATCFELKAALSHPNPAEFVSHLPVHQDGTCNGLQHYAALGGDMWGAQQVNLLPGERPADVYAAVAELVKESVAKDAQDGHEFAAALLGKISRKVVKQTVMTNVYGVTFAGAKKQVLKQLDALYPELGPQTGLPPAILASYIATKIFNALSSMFEGAHDIQNWLGEIGGRVCRALTPEQIERLAAEAAAEAEGDTTTKKKKTTKEKDEMTALYRSTLVWTTPLRMPVVQPYRKNSTKLITTCLQELVLTIGDRDDPVNRRKQLQAFPPNFIHSLDASHMMLSALECDAIGLTFAAVHDSFWTHAADVDLMNRVLRDAFIRIHQEDVIGRLKSEFEARYRGALYRAKVVSNSPIGIQIVKLRKARHMSALEELLEEYKRQQLLNSGDPKKIKEGKKMITPASIFEAFGSPDIRLVGPEDLAPIDEDGEGDAEADAAAVCHVSPGIAEATAEEDTVNLDKVVKPSSLQVHADKESEAYNKSIHELLGANFFAMHLNMSERRMQRQTAQGKKSEIELWLPLRFPAIPKKGEFDVKMLKESHSAAPAADAAITLLPGLPPTCYLKADGSLQTSSCYTHTTTTTVVPKDCPPIKCLPPTNPIACPAVIKITSVPVPCSTNCCPSTPTQTVTKKICPTCITRCVIPTETVTYTTGCPKETIGPIITAPIITGPIRTIVPPIEPTVGPIRPTLWAE
ncbi:hypothetical protein VTJ49DRAFT_5061 [Mycothermus thermophilus]|uniref:DNA-directed RNA polymerase n=1 Tax=Humicola insolens TaxID=85995 RepID=A0ABR3V3Z1_HUMIN